MSDKLSDKMSDKVDRNSIGSNSLLGSNPIEEKSKQSSTGSRKNLPKEPVNSSFWQELLIIQPVLITLLTYSTTPQPCIKFYYLKRSVIKI